MVCAISEKSPARIFAVGTVETKVTPWVCLNFS
jgi:hypothetical protein